MRYTVRFLCSFFEIFRAYIIEIKVHANRAEGELIYDDGEKQRFVWYFSDLDQTVKSIFFLEILLTKKWIHNDQILISKQELIEYLKRKHWQKNDINAVINYVCNIQIFMIDNEEETDYFCIHF